MPTKRRREQLKSARAASLEVFKKRRSEASPLTNSAQLSVDDDKLSTADTTDTEGESGTWFWNESANETDSDTEEEEDGNHEMNLKGDESRTEEAVSSEVHKVEIKWSREGQDKLRGGHGKESKRTQMRHQKSARELEKEASKTYNIQALWQRSHDLGMISTANSHVGLEQTTELAPNDSVSSVCPLSKILQESLPLLSKQSKR